MATTTRMTAWLAALALVPAAIPTRAAAQADDRVPVIAAQEGAVDDGDVADPSTAAPSETPPPPSAVPPPPGGDSQPAAPAAGGQWVYTQQYGWVWMPYADQYTYAPQDGYGEPYEYVYYPAYGWTWVVAPWIWGWGPWPTFGFFGPRHFGWYGHGWWRTPGRWHYSATPFRGGGSFRGGSRPAPMRPSFGGHGGVRPSPSGSFRGGPRAGLHSVGSGAVAHVSGHAGGHGSGGGHVGGGGGGGHGGGHWR